MTHYPSTPHGSIPLALLRCPHVLQHVKQVYITLSSRGTEYRWANQGELENVTGVSGWNLRPAIVALRELGYLTAATDGTITLTTDTGEADHRTACLEAPLMFPMGQSARLRWTGEAWEPVDADASADMAAKIKQVEVKAAASRIKVAKRAKAALAAAKPVVTLSSLRAAKPPATFADMSYPTLAADLDRTLGAMMGEGYYTHMSHWGPQKGAHMATASLRNLVHALEAAWDEQELVAKGLAWVLLTFVGNHWAAYREMAGDKAPQALSIIWACAAPPLLMERCDAVCQEVYKVPIREEVYRALQRAMEERTPRP